MSVLKGQQADFGFEDRPGLQTGGAEHGARLESWNPAEWRVAADWTGLLEQFLSSGTGLALASFIERRLAVGATIYPAQPFRALALTPLAEVKVVILGQDPYHGPGQAHGLAFSVPEGIKPPPSLRNIFKELAREGGPNTVAGGGSLTRWAEQGVLLLNTCLTVEEGSPASHAKQGWEALTDQVISEVSAKSDPVVFMLWGAHAQAKQALIDAGRHLVLSANHPSPLSALRPPRPFIGCGHFSAANAFLQSLGRRPVQW
jgi:uracil-DNA glycosylase